jgi:hypothetical protein
VLRRERFGAAGASATSRRTHVNPKKRAIPCVLLEAVGLSAQADLPVGPASAKPGNPKAGGNSKAAHQCQHGGWKNLRRADQTPFKNTGACVSYAARRGTLTAPKSAAQLLCESLGGVFAPGSGTTLWFCTYNIAGNVGAFNALASRCFADGGTGFGFVSGNISGVRTDSCRR